MEATHEFLETLRERGLVQGRLRGVFHVLIGRRVTRADGTLVSTGVTWRELAAALKNLRWDKELVREVGVDPDTVAPRDRQRLWYAAIAAAAVDGEAARKEAEALILRLGDVGYQVVAPPKG